MGPDGHHQTASEKYPSHRGPGSTNLLCLLPVLAQAVEQDKEAVRVAADTVVTVLSKAEQRMPCVNWRSQLVLQQQKFKMDPFHLIARPPPGRSTCVMMRISDEQE